MTGTLSGDVVKPGRVEEEKNSTIRSNLFKREVIKVSEEHRNLIVMETLPGNAVKPGRVKEERKA